MRRQTITLCWLASVLAATVCSCSSKIDWTGFDAGQSSGGVMAVGGANGTSAMGGAGGVSAMGGAGGVSAMGGAGGVSAMGGAGGVSAMGGAGGVSATCDEVDMDDAGDTCDAGATEPFVATSIAGGSENTCAVLDDGSVLCWGHNEFGELGNGTKSRSYQPVAVVGITNAVAVALRYRDTCAVLDDGSVWCWGRERDSVVPVPVPGVSDAIAIAIGDMASCALLSSGSVQCWGVSGSLGCGSQDCGHQPASVLGISQAVAISAGQEHSCALLNDGTVQCWGHNDIGQVGVGTTAEGDYYGPVTVSGITRRRRARFRRISHLCVAPQRIDCLLGN